MTRKPDNLMRYVMSPSFYPVPIPVAVTDVIPTVSIVGVVMCVWQKDQVRVSALTQASIEPIMMTMAQKSMHIYVQREGQVYGMLCMWYGLQTLLETHRIYQYSKSSKQKRKQGCQACRERQETGNSRQSFQLLPLHSVLIKFMYYVKQLGMPEKGYAQAKYHIQHNLCACLTLSLSLSLSRCQCVYRNLLSFATKESVFFA